MTIRSIIRPKICSAWGKTVITSLVILEWVCSGIIILIVSPIIIHKICELWFYEKPIITGIREFIFGVKE
jgi:hypothetical protein